MTMSGDAAKVMHLCAPGAVGGLERVVELLARGMAEEGLEVHVVAVLSPTAASPEWLGRLQEAGVTLHEVRVGGRQLWREARSINRLLREVLPDVVHTHGYRCDLLHGHRVRRHGALSATTLHGSSRMGGASHLFEWIQGWALARFDVVVAVSEPLRSELMERGVPEDRIALIPNGWAPPPNLLSRDEARKALGIKGKGPVLGWVGRLIPIKGCDIFLEALRLLPEHPWEAVILGDGPERSALEARVRTLGLAERVRFLGSVLEAARYHRAFDAFVLSSRSEGTPMVLLEALGAGVPVVASRVGGVEAALGSEAGRWLVPPEDPEGLRLALEDLLRASGEGDAVVRKATAAGETRAASKFGVGPWVAAHLEAYGRQRAGAVTPIRVGSLGA